MKHSSIIFSLLIQLLIFLQLLYQPQTTLGQNMVYGEVSDRDGIAFRDSLNGWIADSAVHYMGKVPPVQLQLVKYFKYTRDDTVTIRKAWTGDPHFICRYPKKNLEKDSIYSFTVCFTFEGRSGIFLKTMGFELSNGQRIIYTFKGETLE